MRKQLGNPGRRLLETVGLVVIFFGLVIVFIAWLGIIPKRSCDPHQIHLGLSESDLRNLCGKPKSIVDTSYTSAKRLEYKDLVVYVSHADDKVVQWEWTEH